tara:strand:+ start:1058 stop:1762 length:705 start_codon:yes stop_codon:yes gene_type:complete
MNKPPKTWSRARTAGLLYLAIIACGMFAEAAVRSQLVVTDDPEATAHNVVGCSGLFRSALLADLVMMLCDVAVTVLLYQLLRPLSRTLSLLAAAFHMTQTAVIALNLLNMFLALHILGGTSYTDALRIEQQHAIAMLLLHAHKYGYVIGLAFFGVGTLIIAYLACKARPIPRTIGVLLGLAGTGYLADCITFLALPGYDGSASPILLAPALLAELAFAIWLLAKGPCLETLPRR